MLSCENSSLLLSKGNCHLTEGFNNQTLLNLLQFDANKINRSNSSGPLFSTILITRNNQLVLRQTNGLCSEVRLFPLVDTKNCYSCIVLLRSSSVFFTTAIYFETWFIDDILRFQILAFWEIKTNKQKTLIEKSQIRKKKGGKKKKKKVFEILLKISGITDHKYMILPVD